jgi:ABC-type branched-subunit amino acid transport system ATPase component
MALLTVEGITAGYGEMDILHEVSITLEEGEIVSLIGPNGAGKSTLMKSIFGLIKPRLGSITFKQDELTILSPDQIVPLGMCYVPQTENVFPSLTVFENLEMGAFIRKAGIKKRIEKMFNLSSDLKELEDNKTGDLSGGQSQLVAMARALMIDPRAGIKKRIREMFNLFPDLKKFERKKTGDLSGGQRQMVAMARALMLDPTLILLDEPSAGLSPLLVDMIFDKIIEINQTGVSILMVEQNAKQALRLSNRGYVLATGRNRFEGSGNDLLHDEEVARLYLGG